MPRIDTRVSDETIKKIVEIAKDEKRSKAAIIRIAVEEYVENRHITGKGDYKTK
jgi:predicted transcriptional regulator